MLQLAIEMAGFLLLMVAVVCWSILFAAMGGAL